MTAEAIATVKLLLRPPAGGSSFCNSVSQTRFLFIFVCFGINKSQLFCMNKETSMIIFIVILLAFAIGGFYLINRQRKKQQKRLQALKEAYSKALTNSNKAEALQAGRKYYSYLRNGKLTIYDEQAITNDLSTMQA